MAEQIAKGEIVKVRRGKVEKRAYVFGSFVAAGRTWVEYSFVTVDRGSMVVGRPRHYESVESGRITRES